MPDILEALTRIAATMPETPRVVTISIDLDPPISGYGGGDSWEIVTETGAQRDKLLDGIESLLKRSAKRFGTSFKWTGIN